MVPLAVDVAAIRRRLKLSQRRFAETFGFSVGAVQPPDCDPGVGARAPMPRTNRAGAAAIAPAPGVP